MIETVFLSINIRRRGNNRNINEPTEIQMSDLENRARELNVFDLRPFYSSTIFADRGFHADSVNSLIVKTY
jgi:hypothetical protein